MSVPDESPLNIHQTKSFHGFVKYENGDLKDTVFRVYDVVEIQDVVNTVIKPEPKYEKYVISRIMNNDVILVPFNNGQSNDNTVDSTIYWELECKKGNFNIHSCNSVSVMLGIPNSNLKLHINDIKNGNYKYNNGVYSTGEMHNGFATVNEKDSFFHRIKSAPNQNIYKGVIDSMVKTIECNEKARILLIKLLNNELINDQDRDTFVYIIKNNLDLDVNDYNIVGIFDKYKAKSFETGDGLLQVGDALYFITNKCKELQEIKTPPTPDSKFRINNNDEYVALPMNTNYEQLIKEEIKSKTNDPTTNDPTTTEEIRKSADALINIAKTNARFKLYRYTFGNDDGEVFVLICDTLGITLENDINVLVSNSSYKTYIAISPCNGPTSNMRNCGGIGMDYFRLFPYEQFVSSKSINETDEYIAVLMNNNYQDLMTNLMQKTNKDFEPNSLANSANALINIAQQNEHFQLKEKVSGNNGVHFKLTCDKLGITPENDINVLVSVYDNTNVDYSDVYFEITPCDNANKCKGEFNKLGYFKLLKVPDNLRIYNTPPQNVKKAPGSLSRMVGKGTKKRVQKKTRRSQKKSRKTKSKRT